MLLKCTENGRCPPVILHSAYIPSKEFWSTSKTVNVSVSSQLSKEGSVTDSGALLTDTLVMVVLTLHGVSRKSGGKKKQNNFSVYMHIDRCRQ